MGEGHSVHGPSTDLTSLATGPNRTWNPRISRQHSLATLEIAGNMLCCFPRSRGRSQKTPRRQSTCERVRGWIARPRSFRALGRNRPTAMGSTGQVLQDSVTTDSKMTGSSEQVSVDLETTYSQLPSLEEVHLGPATTVSSCTTPKFFVPEEEKGHQDPEQSSSWVRV